MVCNLHWKNNKSNGNNDSYNHNCCYCYYSLYCFITFNEHQLLDRDLLSFNHPRQSEEVIIYILQGGN